MLWKWPLPFLNSSLCEYPLMGNVWLLLRICIVTTDNLTCITRNCAPLAPTFICHPTVKNKKFLSAYFFFYWLYPSMQKLWAWLFVFLFLSWHKLFCSKLVASVFRWQELHVVCYDPQIRGQECECRISSLGNAQCNGKTKISFFFIFTYSCPSW